MRKMVEGVKKDLKTSDEQQTETKDQLERLDYEMQVKVEELQDQIMSIANVNKLGMQSTNISTAFLNVPLKTEDSVRSPLAKTHAHSFPLEVNFAKMPKIDKNAMVTLSPRHRKLPG